MKRKRILKVLNEELVEAEAQYKDMLWDEQAFFWSGKIEALDKAIELLTS